MVGNEVKVVEGQVTTMGGAPTFLQGAAVTGRRSASMEIEIERGKAEIQMKVMAAQAIGRNIDSINAQMLEFCKDPDFAEGAVYALPGKGTGPSVKFAETASTLWGHLHSGYIEYSHDNGQSVVESLCWDMCSNNTQFQRIIIEHATYSTNGGMKYTEDPGSVRQIINNQSQKSKRNVILYNIPAHLRKRWFDACVETNKSVKELPAKLQNGINRFKDKFGIVLAQIEYALGAKQKDMTGEHYATLLSIYNALTEGGSKIDEFFSSLDAIKEAEKKKPDTIKVANSLANAEANARARDMGVTVPQSNTPGGGEKTPTSSSQAVAPEQQPGTDGATVSAPTSPSPKDPVTPADIERLIAVGAKFGFTPMALKIRVKKELNQLTQGELEDLLVTVEQNPKK